VVEVISLPHAAGTLEAGSALDLVAPGADGARADDSATASSAARILSATPHGFERAVELFIGAQ
jgi:hypothetical protein